MTSELTAKELQVLIAIAEGDSNKMISTRLHLSEKTIKGRIQIIFRKLSVQSRTQLVAYAFRAGIVE